MGSPLAPKPVSPGLRPPQVDRGNRDRTRTGRSFEDELADEHEGARRRPGRHPAPRPAPKPPAAHPPAPGSPGPGRFLDIEA